jgi:hypothetical protein
MTYDRSDRPESRGPIVTGNLPNIHAEGTAFARKS